MSKVCTICNQTRTFGHNVSHSKRRTNRSWLPNLVKTKIENTGRGKSALVCARCLKTLSKPKR